MTPHYNCIIVVFFFVLFSTVFVTMLGMINVYWSCWYDPHLLSRSLYLVLAMYRNAKKFSVNVTLRICQITFLLEAKLPRLSLNLALMYFWKKNAYFVCILRMTWDFYVALDFSIMYQVTESWLSSFVVRLHHNLKSLLP